MSDQDLGFSKRLKKAADVAPKPITAPDPSLADLRAMTARAEVISQTGAAVLRKRLARGATQPLNVRLPVATFNAFVELSLAERMSYAETIKMLLSLHREKTTR